MSDIQVIKADILDPLGKKPPALSSTSDMPVIETKPDASPPVVVEAEAAPGPEVEDADTTVDSDTATEPAEEEPGAPEGKKKSQGVQKLLDKLRAEAEQAKRDVQKEREERLRVLTMLEKQQSVEKTAAPAQEPEDTAPERPDRADYPDDNDWDAALLEYSDEKATWTARREIKATIEAERNRAEAESVANAQEAVRQQYQKRIEAVLEKRPDFHEVAESPDVQVSIPVAHAIMHSEQGPELQYYLGSHPDEATRIMNLPIPMQLVELGKIEAKMAAPAVPAKPEVPATPTPAPRISAAPRPITPLKSGDSEPIVKNPENMNMDEYKAMRAKQGAEVRR